jgi:hypothetical protein
LPPTNPELDDDDVIGWRLVPFFSLVVVFLVTKAFSRQGILRVSRRDGIRQPPNPQLQLSLGNNGRIDPVALADFFDAEVVTAFSKKKSSKTLRPVLAEALRGYTISEAAGGFAQKNQKREPKPSPQLSKRWALTPCRLGKKAGWNAIVGKI